MTPAFGGPRYPSRRYDRLRGAQLAPVAVRRAEAGEPRALPLTAVRRGLLEAIGAGKVRYWPSAGWKCSGKAVNATVRDCVAAGWATEALTGDRRTISLTDAGRAALGLDEGGAA